MLLKKYKKIEEESKMIGWDFSFLDGKIIEEETPWNYLNIVKEYLNNNDILLDMGTADGKKLLLLKHPYENTYATEGYYPNYQLAIRNLSSLGINVSYYTQDSRLPYPHSQFDIIINRHESYDIKEIKRILKPNGLFITQQVGSFNNEPMTKILTPWAKRDYETFTLDKELEKSITNNFEILDTKKKLLKIKYLSIDAVIFMAKIIEWEFPGFSAQKSFDGLQNIEKQIKENKYFESIEDRFLIVCRNKKGELI